MVTMNGLDRRAMALAVMGLLAPVAGALAEEEVVDTVVVSDTAGRSAKSAVSSSPEALPASVTVMTAEEIGRRPVSHYTDLFRPVAGMAIGRFQPGGLAVGIAMRGYSSGNHGRELARVVDGMPLSTVGNIGSADLNWIMPEMIERVEVIRGPFSAEYGEDALGGAIAMISRRAGATPMLALSGGSSATKRGMASYSRAGAVLPGGLVPYVAAEAFQTEGWHDNSAYLRRNGFAKLSKDLDGGILSVRLQASDGDWGAPNYFPIAAYRNGTVSERAAVSPSDGGLSGLRMAVLNWMPANADQGWTANAYAYNNEFVRYATTYATGQQVRTADRRNVGGATVKRSWSGEVAGLPGLLLVGGDLRHDDASTARSNTTARNFQSWVYDVDYGRTLLAGFTQGQVKPLRWVKLTLGGRYDQAWFDVDDKRVSAASGEQETGAFSPKAGITVTPLPGLDLFFNHGRGFRMPNVPDELRTNLAMKAQKLTSQEAGLQVELPLDATLRGTVWHTTQDSEIRSVGGIYQNLGASQRDGIDLEARIHLVKDRDDLLGLHASATRVVARLLDRAPSTKVTDVPDYIVNVGAEGRHAFDDGDYLAGSLNIQVNGRKYASDTASLRTKPYEVVQSRLEYGFASGLSVFADGTWVLGDRYAELASATIIVQPEFTAMTGIVYRFQ
ncbi:TonB-dependent receptor plug [Paramagnetospirillum caucaseum]|uniref:TonB-dependent receptor plug n=2 Tax=Paramagnetospirillum caucaseum TaxID=1244869 RepID=M3AFC4_9PROT|nr:TonB-dependent receptor plug [Paramagnetospirillum caucaseum]